MLLMIGVISYSFIAVGASVVVGLILAVSIPRISKKRNLKRAVESGAIWVGLANMKGDDPGSSPVGKQAMAGVGALYGGFFGRGVVVGQGGHRPVGGLLYVFQTGLRWEPRIWLGRGKALPWKLDAGDVVRLETQHLLAIDSWYGRIITASGDILLIVVDPDGLSSAIDKMKSGASPSSA